MPDPLVSVIIPVYNDAECLRMCLSALENQTYPKDRYEVIVVDNGSDDNFESVCKQHKHATLTREEKAGSYAARNRGLSLAKGEIIAFTDSDCIPDPDWIKNGVTNLMSLPNCGLIAGKIRIFCKDPNHPTAVEIYELVEGFHQKEYIEYKRYGATANVFTFKKVFEDVGLFNSELKSGGDKDWGNRVFIAGYKQSYAEDTCVAHPARRTFKQLYRKRARTTKNPRGMGAWKLIARYYRIMRPPVDALVRSVGDDRLIGVKRKFKFAFVLLFVKGVMFYENTRLLLGGNPRR